jgi:hypothetical protein
LLLRSVLVLLLCCAPASGADEAQHPARYAEIQRLIDKNRHLGAHMVRAVDARTVKEVRKQISARDIAVLVQMMGDKDQGVASAASSLLATLGRQAEPALNEAARSRDLPAASQAQAALRLLADCYNEELRGVMNPDVCPADRAGARLPGKPR